jgi:hypothetical protein
MLLTYYDYNQLRVKYPGNNKLDNGYLFLAAALRMASSWLQLLPKWMANLVQI